MLKLNIGKLSLNRHSSDISQLFIRVHTLEYKMLITKCKKMIFPFDSIIIIYNYFPNI